MRPQRRLAVLGIAAALLLVAVFAVAPKAQDQGYHLFADTASLGPVPNALNVLSNLGFLAAGLWGLSAVCRTRGARLRRPVGGAPVGPLLRGDHRDRLRLRLVPRCAGRRASVPSRYPHGRWLAGLVVGYAAALFFEIFDHQVKAALGFTGGHPLKHLAAAAGSACLVWMIKKRIESRPQAYGPS